MRANQSCAVRLLGARLTQPSYRHFTNHFTSNSNGAMFGSCMSNMINPFSGPPPVEVPLTRAPLVRVISQVMFTPILGIVNAAHIAPFQELLRADYPLLDQEFVQRIEITPNQQATVHQEAIWRFQDAEQRWRVSLAPTFVALDTAGYTSRRDFLDRLKMILAATEATLRPQLAQRVGLRYVSRVEGPAFKELSKLIQPAFAGAVATPFGQGAQHLLTESLVATEEGTLTARWGKLPPNMTFDPQTIVPTATESWIHDLDLFKDHRAPFHTAEINELLDAFAKRLYTVFRFMVTDEYLRHYGGNP